MKKFAIFIACIFAAVFAVNAQAVPLPVVDGKLIPSLSAMLQKVMPSVVNVSAQGEISQGPIKEQADQGGDNSKNPQQQQPQGPRKFESMGSGVISDAANGYILTNAHVVKDAQTITVTLSDGRVFKAKLIGMDPPSDIAVLQIKADKLTAAPLGNSDKLKVGDFVAAIGNPFGLNQTVTSGIVSALERTNLGIEGYESFIQTDASINPGNSGGALVSLQGEVVGINTAIFSPAGGNVGIGFAIPINMARSVMSQIIKYGSVTRGLIGVILQDFTPALASAFNITDQTGALVAMVSPNSPAETAGIKTGDLIQGIGGQTVTNAAQVRNAVGLLRVGSEVSMKVLRAGKSITVSLTTADPQKYLAASLTSNPFLYGITLRDFDEQVAGAGHLKGVQVAAIAENSMGWHAGLRMGDVILAGNQKPVVDIAELQKIAQDSRDQLLLNVFRRDGGAEFVVIKKPQGD